MHARPTGRAFIADDHDIARLNLLIEDDRYRFFLGFHDSCRAGEGPQLLFDARCLDDGPVGSEVSAQYNEATVGRKGMLGVVDAAIGGVGIELVPAVGLGEGLRGAHAAGGGVVEFAGLIGGVRVADIPVIEPLFGVVM